MARDAKKGNLTGSAVEPPTMRPRDAVDDEKEKDEKDQEAVADPGRSKILIVSADAFVLDVVVISTWIVIIIKRDRLG